jgi:hypothetical protein
MDSNLYLDHLEYEINNNNNNYQITCCYNQDACNVHIKSEKSQLISYFTGGMW